MNAMQKLYACLEDADFVVGVAAIRREEPLLDSQILYNQVTVSDHEPECAEFQRSQIFFLDFWKMFVRSLTSL